MPTTCITIPFPPPAAPAGSGPGVALTQEESALVDLLVAMAMATLETQL